MKATHKRKTIAEGKNNYPYLPYKRKHNSYTNPSIQGDINRLVVLDVIQQLLSKTYEQQRERSQFFSQAIKQLNRLQIQDSLYFNLNFQETAQVMCKQDMQPPAQENRCLQVKKVKKLNKTSKKKLNNESQEIGDSNGGSSRTSILEVDKKDRDNIIQKLKKEYSMILQTKYLSESTPIGQSRDVFIQCDTPQITNLRMNFVKKPLKKKQQKHKDGFVEAQIRKNNKLKTIFKKSKDFIETMDPTMSNSIYMSQIQPTHTSHRNSVVNVPVQNEGANVKLSKFKEITNTLPKVPTVVVLPKYRSSKIQPVSNANKMINLIAEQERQALKQRVERSFHSNQRSKFREISQTQRKPRVNNSMSVSFLPKLQRL